MAEDLNDDDLSGQRQALHVYLTRTASDAFETIAFEGGVSVSGLVEALGRRLADQLAQDGDPESFDPELVRAARKIDSSRRRRRGRPH